MAGKIKGPGGIGQFDLGTATQDVRAATPRQPSRNTGNSGGGILQGKSGPGYTTPLTPGMKGYTPLRGTGRKKGRGKARGKRK